MTTTTKGLIAKEDLKLYDGVNSTFSRKTSSGGTGTYDTIDWVGVDVESQYGARTIAALNSAMAAVGTTNKRAFFLSPGTWTIDEDITITSNITLLIPPGANLAISNTKTLTVAGPIEAGAYQIYSGAGTFTYSFAAGVYHNEWASGGSGIKFYTAEIATSLTMPDNTVITSTAISVLGRRKRAAFSYSDTDTITIGPAVYYHAGTTNQIVYWDSDITFDLGSGGSNAASDDLTANAWHYIYLDDSAIITQAATLLDADCFLNDTTGPTWSDAKHGYYNGSDRCIFAVYTNASSQVLSFYQDGDLVLFDERISVTSGSTTPTTSWVDIPSAFTMPNFARRAVANFKWEYVDAYNELHWRTNGSSAGNGHTLCAIVAGATIENVTSTVITDSNHLIEMYESSNSANTVEIMQDGWYLPDGM